MTSSSRCPAQCRFWPLAPGASTDCTASGVAVEGQYANLGTVVAQPVGFGEMPELLGAPVMDDDPSHYVGSAACIPKKHKPKPKTTIKHRKGTKYIKVEKVIYIVVWKLKQRYVKMDGHLYRVDTGHGKPFVNLDGKKYIVKTLQRTRKLALGGGLPPCPKDDKKDKPKKDDKPKDGKPKDGKQKGDKGHGGTGYTPPSGKPFAGDTQAGTVVEPIGAPGLEHASCVGSKQYWLKGAGRNDAAWTKFGPEGKKTRFFANKQTYLRVFRKGSSRPYFRMARAYITAMLNMHSGALMTPEMEQSVAFAERHFSGHNAGYTNVKRALKAQSSAGSKVGVKKIKKLRKKMLKHTVTLRDHGDMPSCTI